VSQKRLSSKTNRYKPVENSPGDNAPIPPIMRFFFIRPIFAILLTFLLVGSGIMAYQSIVKEAAPDLAIPQAIVQTEWAGADPETIEKQITNQIEKKIKSMKGLKRIRSASFNSFSVIAVEFRPSANLMESMQILRVKVRDAEPDLPKDAKKPKIEQVSIDDTPMLTVALFGKVDPIILGNTAKYLKERLERLPGVKKVDLGGRRKEVVQILLDPSRLVALGISPTAVRDRIRTANLDMPWDKIESDKIGATVRLYGRFRDVKDLAELPVSRLNAGRVVRLDEIGDVHRDLEREKSSVSVSWAGSTFAPSVDISVMKVPGVDTLKTIERIKSTLQEAFDGPGVPYGLHYSITSDQSEFIWEKLKDVFNTAGRPCSLSLWSCFSCCRGVRLWWRVFPFP